MMLGINLLFLVAYVVLIVHVAVQYSLLSSTDALALLDVSSPLLNLLIIGLAFQGFVVYACKLGVRNQLFLLESLGLVLVGTPYFLSNGLVEPDTPWHLGVVVNLPQALSHITAFGMYAFQYPGFFVEASAVLQVSGIPFLQFGRLVWPSLVILLIVLLFYVLGSKLSSRRTAFLAVLVTMLVLYMLDVHPSPESNGDLLTLTTLVLLFDSRKRVRGLGLLTIIALVLTHPTSPFVVMSAGLGILVASSSVSRRASRDLILLIIIPVISWLAWALYLGSIAAYPFISVIEDLISFGFLHGQTGSFTASLFPNVARFREATLGSLLIFGAYFAILVSGRPFPKSLFRLPNRLLSEMKVKPVLYTLLFLGAILFYIVFVNGGLIREPFDYFGVFFASLVISSLVVLSEGKRRLSWMLPLLIWLLMLGTIYPTVGYELAAPNNYTQAQLSGMSYLAPQIGTHVLYTWRPEGFTLYAASTDFRAVDLLQLSNPLSSILQSNTNDLIVFPQTAFFEVYELAATPSSRNLYTSSMIGVQANPLFDRIFSNPSCQAFVRI